MEVENVKSENVVWLAAVALVTERDEIFYSKENTHFASNLGKFLA